MWYLPSLHYASLVVLRLPSITLDIDQLQGAVIPMLRIAMIHSVMRTLHFHLTYHSRTVSSKPSGSSCYHPAHYSYYSHPSEA